MKLGYVIQGPADFDEIEDKQQHLHVSIADQGKATDAIGESIAILTDEIVALTKSIKDLDKPEDITVI